MTIKDKLTILMESKLSENNNMPAILTVAVPIAAHIA
jgi:hypothetical protein